MFRNRRVRYADVMSTFAAFVALGGVGYAAATLPANSVGDRQIKRGAVRSDEVKNGSLAARDFREGVLPSSGTDGTAGTDGSDGSDGSDGTDGAVGPAGPAGPMGPQGPRGLQGLTGPEGPQGPAGTARAYAVVDPTCPSNICSYSHSTGISGVTRISTGNYCVNAPGITSEVTPAFAAPEYSKTSNPRGSVSAAASSSSGGCLAGQFLVVTHRMTTATAKADPTGTVSVATPGQADNSVAFSILIP